MHVNVNESLTDIFALSNYHLAIYFHEYIHFIQDISTTYGLMNACIIVDYLKLACNKVLNSNSDSFLTPILPEAKAADNVQLNLELRKIYLGSTKELNGITVHSVKKLFSTVDFPNTPRKVPCIQVEYKETSHSINHFLFGAYYLMESMAYIAESLIFPNHDSAHQIPYFAAELLAGEIYPPLTRNRLNILALCDVSLCTFHPGEFFFDMLIKIKSENWLPSKPRDIYRYCNKGENCYKSSVNLQNLLLNTSKEAIKQLTDYFSSDTFKDHKKWIEYTLNKAVNIRLSFPSFIADIIKTGHLQKNKNFINLFTKLGTPMVTNAAGEATFYSPIQDKYNLRPDLLWIINQIFKIFAGSQKKCDLKTSCQTSCKEQQIPDVTDFNCDNSPWEKAKIDPLCAFGQIWTMWGLSNKKPL